MRGYVKNFLDNKGYGFITDGDNDYFVHFRDIKGDGHSYRTLRRGQSVTFEVEKTARGAKAVDVEVV